MSYTLTTLRDKVKRRIRVLRATTDLDTEAESGQAFSNNAIDDAINAGRKQIMITVRNAELWGKVISTFPTTADVQEYALDDTVIKILSVQYDCNSDGTQGANEVNCINVVDRKGEEKCLADPMDVPSVTNPKYRVTNIGIRLIVSTDGTVPAGKYIRVEYIGELSDLINETDTSGLSSTLDEMVINWAIWVLGMYVMPNVAAIARQEFYKQAGIMNSRRF